MSLTLIIYTWSIFVIGILNSMIAIQVYRRIHRPGGVYLFWMVLSMAWWGFTEVGEQLASTVYTKQIWASVVYLSVQTIPPLLLFFSIEFTRIDKKISRKITIPVFVALLSVLPILFTNPYHHLYWGSFEWNPQHPSVLIFHGGPLYWFNIAIIYAILLASMTILVHAAVRFRHIYRAQFLTLLFALPLPFLHNIIYMAGLSPVEGVDFTPTGFTLFIFLIAWGFFKLDLFDLSPLARDHLIDNLEDAILVISPDERIVDLNPAFLRIILPENGLHKTGSFIGKEIQELIDKNSELYYSLQMRHGEYREIEVSDQGAMKQFRVKLSIITRKDGLILGKLAVLNDITEYRELVFREIQDRKLLESIRDIALSLSSSIQHISIHHLILEHLSRVLELKNAVFLEASNGNMMIRARYFQGKAIEVSDDNIAPGAMIDDMSFEPGPWIHSASGELFLELFHQPASTPRIDLMIIPIVVGGEVTAYVIHDFAEAQLQNRDALLKTAELFSAPATIAYENQQLFLEKERLATTDALTSLLNRRHFYELGAKELTRSKRFGNSMSAIMVDIDHFKNINDTYGHYAGDHALLIVSSILKNTVRKEDLVCRFGGEEFVVVFIQCGADSAMNVAERIRNIVQSTQITFDESAFQITVSIGLTELKDEDHNLDDVLQRADRNLYIAKNRGRNRIVSNADGDH